MDYRLRSQTIARTNAPASLKDLQQWMEHTARQTQYWWPTSWSLHVELITGNRLNPQYQPPCSLPTHAPHSRLIEQLTSYLPSCSTEDCCISVPHFSLPGSILQRLESKVLFSCSYSQSACNLSIFTTDSASSYMCKQRGSSGWMISFKKYLA